MLTVAIAVVNVRAALVRAHVVGAAQHGDGIGIRELLLLLLVVVVVRATVCVWRRTGCGVRR